MRRCLAAAPALITLAITMGVVVPTAKADLPPDQTVTYRLHVIPTDRASATHSEIRLELAAVEQFGSEIAWQVRSIRITRFDAESASISKWLDEYPVVQTASGLWHILHADPMAPTLDEFADPPLMLGIATGATAYTVNLEYRIEGTSPPPGSPLNVYEVTSLLDYALTPEGEHEPTDEGEDEPVETTDGEDDPT